MTPWTKRLAILLAISVGLNLLLAGFWIGRRVGGPAFSARGSDAAPAFAPSARRHPALRGALDRHRDEFREQREETRKARLAAREALTKTEFDREAVDKALAKLRLETTRSQELTHRAILEAASTAKPEQRRDLGKALGPSSRGK